MRIVPVAHSGYHDIRGFLDGDTLYLLDAAPALYVVYDGELFKAPMLPHRTWKDKFTKGWETQVLIPDEWKEIDVPYERDDLFWKNWYISKAKYKEWFERVPYHVILHDYHALTVRLVNLERYKGRAAYDASLEIVGVVFELPFEGRKRRIVLLDDSDSESARIKIEDGKFLVLNRCYPQVNWIDNRKNGIIELAFPRIPRTIGIRTTDEDGNLLEINLEVSDTGWNCFNTDDPKPVTQSGNGLVEIQKEGDLYIIRMKNKFRTIKDLLIC